MSVVSRGIPTCRDGVEKSVLIDPSTSTLRSSRASAFVAYGGVGTATEDGALGVTNLSTITLDN